ncbi:1-phosphatidylinositol-3-phosphate 5-kinase [Tulasnella sp. 331]|nr:1-phosphatidylinositol-3-phosphate 5-kinase [Tulasnella sp. 331]
MTETASIVSSRSSTHRRGGTGLNVNLNDDVRPRTGRMTETGSMYSRNDDATTLTLFGNPFENDEKEDTSWSSLLSKVKNTFSAPVSAAVSTTAVTTPSSSGTSSPPIRHTEEPHGAPNASRRSSNSKSIVSVGTSARIVQNKTFALRQTSAAPPLVSLTPVISEQPSFPGDNHSDGGSMRGASPGPGYLGGSMEAAENSHYGHFIPGFPINDDAKSIRTTGSGGGRNESASKVIRRLRGQGGVGSRESTGWMMRRVKSVTTARAYLPHGAGSIIAESVCVLGQIFCSRCASNIIKAARFGSEGMLRVCNLCLSTATAVEEEDDDDDRRSVVSTNFPPHQLDMMRSHSPYHSSPLHLKSEEHNSLFPIGESRYHEDDGGFGSGSRPSTPADQQWSEPPGPAVPPPFRRGIKDDDKETESAEPLESMMSASPSASSTQAAVAPASPASVPFPKRAASNGVPLPELSTIQFPASPSSSDGKGSPHPLRSRFNSYATEYDPIASLARTRRLSRMEVATPDIGNDEWRMRRESSAYAAELNAVSMFHLRIMLRQMLTKEKIPYHKEWEETLTKLALKVASHLNLTPRTLGSSIDARWYVKIKKIPGGAPRDSEYVDGAVITKNVAHKQMSRHIRQPRIMLVTFPVDYHRVEGQFMSIDPILAQEKAYLENLADRVAAHHPHVLLVEGSVSRLALDFLLEKKIAVARSVKASAIQLVSRITQSDIISSMDRLALEPRMGDCARFRIQTFEHALIPGRRKTYMRFEGCSREMGCSIILRGGDVGTLQKVKKITRFIVFIVRNLKMETFLWKDSILTMPPVNGEAAPHPARPRVSSSASVFTISGLSSMAGASSVSGLQTPTYASPQLYKQASRSVGSILDSASQTSGDESTVDEEAQWLKLSQKIQAAIEPYLTTFISASATLRFPPPYPVRRMKELDDSLEKAKSEWMEAQAALLLREERAQRSRASSVSQSSITSGQSEDDANGTTSEPARGPSVSSSVEGFPPSNGAIHLVRFDESTKTPMPLHSPTPVLAESKSSLSYFDHNRSIMSESSLTSSALSSVMDNPYKSRRSGPPIALREASDIERESELSALKFEHQEMQRIWEWHLRKNKDDLVAETYQKISLLHATIPTIDLDPQPPCVAPHMKYMEYYGENDCTLAHFIEDACRKGYENRPCDAKGCKLRYLQHSEVYAHNETRLLITTEPWDATVGEEKEVYPPPSEFITTWSTCRVCDKGTPFITLSEEACRYSLAKFMELHFYPADVRLLRGVGCLHNVYLHHIRFFAVNRMTVRFQTDPIKVFEITFPPLYTQVKQVALLDLKNKDYQHMVIRSDEYWESVSLRITQWQTAIGGTADHGAQERGALPMATAVADMAARLDRDRKEILALMQRTYAESAPTNTLAIGPVRTAIQNKVVQWDNEFDRLEKTYFSLRNYFATEKEFKKLTGANLKRVYDFINGAPSTNPEAGAKRSHLSQIVQPPSSASENDSAAEADPPSEPSHSESEAKEEEKELAIENPIPLQVEGSNKSDAESDSTIGATGRGRDEVEAAEAPGQAEQTMESLLTAEDGVDRPPGPPAISRLPRRLRPRPSVAELVRQFQPPTGDDGSSIAPSTLNNSESEQESILPPRRQGRSKVPSRTYGQKPMSEFDRSYAVNAAPHHHTPSRRRTQQLGGPGGSRIPIPVSISPPDSVEDLNGTAKGLPTLARKDLAVPSLEQTVGDVKVRNEVHPRAQPTTTSDVSERRGTPVQRGMPKGKPVVRRIGRDKPAAIRPTVSVRGTTRRVIAPTPGTKVSHIANQFERISRDNEKDKRRYAIMKGRRARPVASSKAKVEIFDNMMDAARDESEDGSEASSEADDEDDGDDERKRTTASLEESMELQPPVTSYSAPTRLIISESLSEEPQQTEDPYVDLSSPVVARPSISQVPPPPGPITTPPSQGSSRPTSPLPDASPPTRAGSSYISGHSESEYSIGGAGERQSVINTIAGYSGFSWMREPMPAFSHLKYPASPSEHLFEEAPITVREDEPTSIIAFTLQSAVYLNAMSKSKATVKLSERPEVFMPDNDGSVSDSQSWGLISLDGHSDTINDIKEPRAITHPVFHFESGGVQISCTVFHAEQFDALRRSCHCEQSMIESLARCVKWDVSGGKSGSAFLKSRGDVLLAILLVAFKLTTADFPADNRFIAKELSRSELDAMSKFAPKYFEYMSNSISAKQHTLLAKLFGFYKIVYKNSVGRTVRMTLLVMENLFYDHRFCQIYDLKGSSRNRLAHPTASKPDQVLLDENLLQNAYKSPFYIREHAKRILRGALWNDSQFLEELNVMDYSLLVAVDDATNEIVVGIVDYIRTYTWDKKLESWVKETTFLGGSGKGEPTIVTPKQYKTRFRNAMERYFILVPDRWMKVKDQDQPDEDRKSER